MSTLACLLLLLGIVPFEPAITDRVTCIELNHFYDEHGRHVFDQHLFWDWKPYANRHHLRDWRLIKAPTAAAYFDATRDEFRTQWHDGLSLRSVSAPQFRETWTQYDPEVAERAVLPKELRRELTNARTFNFQEEP